MNIELMELNLFKGHIRRAAAKFSAHNLPDDAKRRLMVACVQSYKPGVRVMDVVIEAGRIVEVAADHPHFELVEVRIGEAVTA